MKHIFLVFCLVLCAILLTAYVCFRLAFYVSKKQRKDPDPYAIPPGKIYEPHREIMVKWMKEADALVHKELSITSFDGLQLYGNFYEYAPGAPIELMFHGYRGSARRDLCGGVQRCFSLGRSALVVDQRTSGKSGGRVISFGINEHRDCLDWVRFMISYFGEDVKIYLTGISMGASTVLMAAGTPLPKQVIGVVADCGYTSPRAIIQKVICQLKLPAKLLYPFVRLGAILYGGFDPESFSPIEAVKTMTVPVVFAHGETDDFVPCRMSIENYEACSSPNKLLFTVPDTGHGLAYIKDPEGYKKALQSVS
ncbi:MAG: alpha/beta hydrolase [Oscillospiraceae bacterium]|nr:alpha/beta hydrolase [Oscillospiraceae bacterium]